ncbi:hypothetical protein CJU94_37415 (plasmid) [Paraburkholderia aromaticivorans]|uniref:Uncharacterized protein n=1 Tax=Paraburkholderia aromaticivorans TaxID=2026199 RepID=A0A248VXW1_9BURK|nr:hypothetical protein CJU94_37415 [Paraburkholderia aromaticivorans]
MPELQPGVGRAFKTHPNPALLLAEWEKIASQIPLMVLKNGAQDVSHNANVVIAQRAPAHRALGR